MAGVEGKRLGCLDALRGLDMAFLVGLDSIIVTIAAEYPESTLWQTLNEQMRHAAWEGLTLYDVIFPLFVFLAGVSMYLSQQKHLSQEGRGKGRMLGHMWKRAAILVALGWLVNGSLSWDLSHMRFASVLGLIGISCATAGTLALIIRNVWGIVTCAVIILGSIGIAQNLDGTINATIDNLLCPGVLHSYPIDPEGPLCIASATGLALLGWLAGRSFTRRISPPKRALALACSGSALLFISPLTGTIIKTIWTPAFVCTTAGIGCLLLALFHLIIEGRKWIAWTYPLRVLGSNALFIYLITHIIDFGKLNERIFGGAIGYVFDTTWQPTALSITYLLLAWWLCFVLYKRQIFIKV